MSKKEYPYQNRSLDDMEGEEWEDIPGLGGYFMISNFGRVMRLEYETQFDDGRIYRMKPMIIKPTLTRSINSFSGEKTFFLHTTITLSGKTYNFSIARMVYYCFEGSFDFEDKHFLVVCKNGDNKNVVPANLELISMHNLLKKAFAENKREIIILRPEIRAMGQAAMIKKAGKVISQYNLAGNKISTFQNVPEAAIATGLNKSNISGVLRGRKVTAGGYAWRYGEASHIDLEDYLQERQKKYKQGLRTMVTQYDMQGKKINTFTSLNEAARQTGILSNVIGKVINGKAKSAGNFFWKKGAGKNKINLDSYRYGTGSGSFSIQKPVNQLTKEGKLVASYLSITAAAKAVGITPGCLVGALKGTYKTAGGYKWQYK